MIYPCGIIDDVIAAQAKQGGPPVNAVAPAVGVPVIAAPVIRVPLIAAPLVQLIGGTHPLPREAPATLCSTVRKHTQEVVEGSKSAFPPSRLGQLIHANCDLTKSNFWKTKDTDFPIGMCATRNESLPGDTV